MWRTRGQTAAGIIAVLAVWESASRAGILPRAAFPPATAVLSSLWDAASTRDLWLAVGQTLMGWGLGLGVAAVFAIPLGAVIGSSRLVYRSVRVTIELLRPVPSVALIPLAILLFGIGLASTVFLGAFASFWIMLIHTVYGVRDVDPVADETARVFAFSRRTRLFRLTLPAAMPYVATGVRLASAVALALAVTAELVIGSPGLGHSISLARSGTNIELMYALIIVIGTLGWALNAAATRIERRVLHWHPGHRAP